MTGQDEMKPEGNMDVLKAEAKELGIKGLHFFKTPESLAAKIADAKKALEAKAAEPKAGTTVVEPAKQADEAPKRSKAPSMVVSGVLRDDRASLIARLEAEDPECKYVFQAHSVTDAQLAAKGLERTGQKLKNDIVCRTVRESYEGFVKAKNTAQFDEMQRIDGGTGIVEFLDAKAKNPKERDRKTSE